MSTRRGPAGGRGLTLLQASHKALAGGQGGGGVDDPGRDGQLLPHSGVTEQGDLAQREAVGGQPVGEHRLGGGVKDTEGGGVKDTTHTHTPYIV